MNCFHIAQKDSLSSLNCIKGTGNVQCIMYVYYVPVYTMYCIDRWFWEIHWYVNGSNTFSIPTTEKRNISHVLMMFIRLFSSIAFEIIILEE